MNTLNKTKNFYRAIGTVSEIKLKRDTVKIDLKDEKGNVTGSATTNRIMGEVSVCVGKGVMSFNTYQTELNSFCDKNGKHDNPRWKMAEAMTEWNPKINGDPNIEPTVVEISGTVAINDYPKDGEVRSSLRWNISKATTNADISNKGASLGVVGYIQSIKPEVVGEEATGRLKVRLYGADGNGACFPIDCIVDEELADDFTDTFAVGQTIEADIDVHCTHVGGDSNKKKQFGRSASVAMNTGYDKRELMIVGADVIEEPDELTVEDENGNEVPVKTKWIDPATMKKAIKEREKHLDELKNGEGNDKKSATKSTGSKLKEAKKSNYDFENSDEDEPF